MMACGCQYLGPEFDARKWKYTEAPTPYCGKPTVQGKSYCHDHYYVVYQKGTAIAGRRKEKIIEKEIEDLKKLQEIDDMEAYDA
jgi:hypothetical protein